MHVTSKSGRVFRVPSATEDARIVAGIAAVPGCLRAVRGGAQDAASGWAAQGTVDQKGGIYPAFPGSLGLFQGHWARLANPYGCGAASVCRRGHHAPARALKVPWAWDRGAGVASLISDKGH